MPSGGEARQSDLVTNCNLRPRRPSERQWQIIQELGGGTRRRRRTFKVLWGSRWIRYCGDDKGCSRVMEESWTATTRLQGFGTR